MKLPPNSPHFSNQQHSWPPPPTTTTHLATSASPLSLSSLFAQEQEIPLSSFLSSSASPLSLQWGLCFLFTSPFSSKWASSSTKLFSTVTLSLKEENPPSIRKNHFPILQKSKNSVIFEAKRMGKQKPMFKFLRSEAGSDRFFTRLKEVFGSNSCKSRFFMTWISSIDRELFTVESLFRAHPHGCLIIVSNSMDSTRGIAILRPFLGKGFHVNSISPDFDYLLKHTVAESWFNRLRKGDVEPGEVSLGQNLSDLLRLALLYKFGGVYLDTDVIILKSFKIEECNWGTNY